MSETRTSFIVTGASASGKTSLTRHAYSGGYDILPTHTTRPLRQGEIDGVDIVSIGEEEFRDNFAAGYYLESSLNFALLEATGVYYGTPQKWGERLAKEAACAMPTSLTVARSLRDVTGMSWVHLECPPDVRRQRLQERGIADWEIEARMTSGESVVVPSEADIIVDSSIISTDGIFRVIRELPT